MATQAHPSPPGAVLHLFPRCYPYSVRHVRVLEGLDDLGPCPAGMLSQAEPAVLKVSLLCQSVMWAPRPDNQHGHADKGQSSLQIAHSLVPRHYFMFLFETRDEYSGLFGAVCLESLFCQRIQTAATSVPDPAWSSWWNVVQRTAAHSQHKECCFPFCTTILDMTMRLHCSGCNFKGLTVGSQQFLLFYLFRHA